MEPEPAWDDDRVDRLRLVCREFRHAIEACERMRLAEAFEKFPRGSCFAASMILAKYLAGAGFGRFRLMTGARGDETHAWLQNEELIVDITADQFGDSPAVFVGRTSIWHSGFAGRVEVPCAATAQWGASVDERSRISLATVLEQIRKSVAGDRKRSSTQRRLAMEP